MCWHGASSGLRDALLADGLIEFVSVGIALLAVSFCRGSASSWPSGATRSVLGRGLRDANRGACALAGQPDGRCRVRGSSAVTSALVELLPEAHAGGVALLHLLCQISKRGLGPAELGLLAGQRLQLSGHLLGELFDLQLQLLRRPLLALALPGRRGGVTVRQRLLRGRPRRECHHGSSDPPQVLLVLPQVSQLRSHLLRQLRHGLLNLLPAPRRRQRVSAWHSSHGKVTLVSLQAVELLRDLPLQLEDPRLHRHCG
mmetsp:Transcript_51148/g.148511  ORF Transcript_51148/g.148511 Transcript_51148/m.148511 type:complete len:257 (-) Transcript_51148:1012-1782(-)